MPVPSSLMLKSAAGSVLVMTPLMPSFVNAPLAFIPLNSCPRALMSEMSRSLRSMEGIPPESTALALVLRLTGPTGTPPASLPTSRFLVVTSASISTALPLSSMFLTVATVVNEPAELVPTPPVKVIPFIGPLTLPLRVSVCPGAYALKSMSLPLAKLPMTLPSWSVRKVRSCTSASSSIAFMSGSPVHLPLMPPLTPLPFSVNLSLLT